MESPDRVERMALAKAKADAKAKARRVAELKAKQKDELTWSGGGMKLDNSPAADAYRKNLKKIYPNSKGSK